MKTLLISLIAISSLSISCNSSNSGHEDHDKASVDSTVIAEAMTPR
jgi:hypothetical protein